MTDQPVRSVSTEAPAPPASQARVIQPGESASYWQPVPANGFVEIILTPAVVSMEHPVAMGTQTVPPGCFVREHAHDRNEEVLYFLKGRGKVVVEGHTHELVPGTTMFMAKGWKHTFINDSEEDMQFLWMLLPNGLEDFFQAIGRRRQAGEIAPTPFARPENILEIERNTVFATPSGGTL